MVNNGASKASSRSQSTRKALLKSARKVFSSKGVASARVQDIVKDAKVSHGTFYVYFKNKDDILLEVLTPVLDELYETAMASWDKGDIFSSVRHAVKSYLEFYSRNSDVMGVLVEGSARDPVLKRLYNDTRKRFQRRIRKNLEIAAERGLTHDLDYGIAAAALGSLVDGFAYQWFYQAPVEGRRSVGIDELSDVIASLWCNAIYRHEEI